MADTMSSPKVATRTLLSLGGMLMITALALAQSAAPAPAGCTKNVSFAVTAGGEPVAAIPGFVVHSIGNEKRKQRYPGLCFAQSPDPRYKNYVVVFSTQQDGLAGLVPLVLKYVSSAPISENRALSAVYGEMWHYISNQAAAGNATTLNLLHTDTSTALFVRVYNEQGAIVSQLSLKDISGWLHTKEKLLDRALEDIRADSGQRNTSPVPVQTSLPVYYVNCDVPVKDLARQEKPVTLPAAPAAPQIHVATLEFWSSPAGADVYLDARLVGKTPSSFSTVPGEYTITMRKQNFGTWQRKLQVTEGKRRVTGYLEQRVVVIGSVMP